MTLFFWRVYFYFISFHLLNKFIVKLKKRAELVQCWGLLEGKSKEKGTEILPLVLEKYD